ncbi:MAG: alpha-1,2-fucosyltransferase [Lachnospiraceae bacterium]|nr:alpha-1,2-fucosyltransferase [Lachnospiraceae bacterium]
MIIIQMAGGLGNQMFQYALYKQFISMGKSVSVDDEAGFREDAQRNPALAAFGIVYERAARDEIIRITDSSMAFMARVRRKLFGRNNHSYFEEDKIFQPQIFGWDDVYLEGYWQSEKYFADVAESLKTEYGLDSVLHNKTQGYGLSQQAMMYLEQIERTESVSIHVRGGDYRLPQNQALFGDICTKEYYRQALEIILAKHPYSRCYLFTNDRMWTDKWLGEYTENMVLVDWPKARDYEVLTLMSRCKHNILANSSFSWWASYLNDYEDKMVIAPEKWLNGWDCRDIYRDDMMTVGACR